MDCTLLILTNGKFQLVLLTGLGILIFAVILLALSID